MVQLEITIEQGTLRGSIGTDLRGQSYFKFQGIPYAKPPIGDLRFKAPVPPEKWTGIFDATKHGDVSYARDLYKLEIVSGGENCLLLNVYTKNLPGGNEKNLRPVLFWIHGGGFLFGSGNEELYGPDFLITEDVVVVTINYRLGILGFLSLEDPSLGVPGNAGLKDQVMALKWVQKNISKFGGDPNNVTIFGESAGGASVHLLVLSPMSKGLFHKAIAQSGCALNPWVRAEPNAKRIAPVLNLEGSDEKTIYNALMKKSVEELFEIQEKAADEITACEPRGYGLVIEKGTQEPAFLSEEPIKILQSGKFNQVPFMIGLTTAEGLCFEIFKSISRPEFPTFADMIPWYFGYQTGSPEWKAVVDKIKKFYYGDEEPSPSNFSKKIDMLSDCMFAYGIYVTTVNHFHLSKAPTYMYLMSLETGLNFFRNIIKPTIPGVSHCDDIGYLFKHFATPKIEPGSVEDVSLTKFVKLWTNFAKTGNPTPDKNDPLLKVAWKPVTSGEKMEYLDIGRDLVVKTNPLPERMNFWKDFFANSPAGQKAECVYPRRSK